MSSIRTLNPTTGELIKEYPEMTPAELDVLIGRAHDAYKKWRKTPIAERGKIMKKVAEIMLQRKEELAKICAIEMGKILPEGEDEVQICADIYTYFAEHAERLLQDKEIKSPFGRSIVTYEPTGIILSVQPWNFPFYQMTRSIAPNLMAGNVVMMKQASNVPLAAATLEQIFKDAGAPEGVYTNLFVPGSKVSELLNDPRMKGATLTGSMPAGSSFAATAGKNIIKSMLELGGNDAFVVMPNADIDEAVKTAVMGRMWNAGQVCCSPKRIIVTESIAKEFIEKAKHMLETVKVGNPLERDTVVSPMSSEEALNKVLAQVEKAVSQGATLATGGKKIDGPGFFMKPALLLDIKNTMDIYTEEVFGPVMMIYVVKDIDAAIEQANDTTFGLGGTVFGPDIEECVKVARQIVTGMVYINHVTVSVGPETPFGGTNKSGYGRELSDEAIYEFMNPKFIRITSPAATY